MTDFDFCNNGTIWMLDANNDDAQAHLNEHLDNPLMFGGRVVVDHRMAPDLAENLLRDGMTVAVDGQEVVLREAV